MPDTTNLGCAKCVVLVVLRCPAMLWCCLHVHVLLHALLSCRREPRANIENVTCEEV